VTRLPSESPPLHSRYLLSPSTPLQLGAMAHIRRASVSSTLSNRSASPLVFVAASNADTDEWVKAWRQVMAQGTDHISRTSCLAYSDWFPHIPVDLVESPVVAIDVDESVEVACDVRRLWSRCVYRSRIYANSTDPLIIRRPLFGRTGEGFHLSRTIRCVYPPHSLKYALLPLLSMLMSTRSWCSRPHNISPPNEKTPPILIGQKR